MQCGAVGTMELGVWGEARGGPPVGEERKAWTWPAGHSRERGLHPSGNVMSFPSRYLPPNSPSDTRTIPPVTRKAACRCPQVRKPAPSKVMPPLGTVTLSYSVMGQHMGMQVPPAWNTFRAIQLRSPQSTVKSAESSSLCPASCPVLHRC